MILTRIAYPALALAGVLSSVAAQTNQAAGLLVRDIPAEWRATSGVGRYTGKGKSGPSKRDLSKMALSQLTGRQDPLACETTEFACEDGSGCCDNDQICCSGSAYCAPIGGECCTSGIGGCEPGFSCCDLICIPNGTVCCGSGGYCAEGNLCVAPPGDYDDIYCCTDSSCEAFVGEDGITTTRSAISEATAISSSGAGLFPAIETAFGSDDVATTTLPGSSRATDDADDDNNADDDNETDDDERTTAAARSSSPSLTSSPSNSASTTTDTTAVATDFSADTTTGANDSDSSSQAASIGKNGINGLLAYTLAVGLGAWLL